MWTALAIEQCRINFRAIVIVGINEPSEHVLAVHRLDPMLFHFAHTHLREHIVVDGGNLLAVGLVVGEVIDIDFSRVLDGNLVGIEFAVYQLKAMDVVVAVRNLAELFGGAVVGENFVHAAVVHHTQNLLVVIGPADVGEVVVEVLRHVGALAGGEVQYHKAQFVALVSVALHTFPREVLAVVAEYGVLVVAHDALADILRGFLRDVVQENIAVGGVCVIAAGLFAAGIGDGFAVGAVVVLLHAAPRTHRALEGAVDEADGIIYIHLLAVKLGEEDLRIFINPVVPVAVHEVLVDTAGGLVEAGVEFL